VTPAEIAARLRSAAAERAGNTLRVERALAGHIPARAYGMDIQGRIRAGVAALSDEELRDLARRAETLATDPVAGASKTLIIVGVAVLVVIVLAALIVKSCKEQGAECLDED
jgi:CHASE3 domain sensor protein